MPAATHPLTCLAELLVTVTATAVAAPVSFEATADRLVLTAPAYRVEWSASDGRLLQLCQRPGDRVLLTRGQDLWRAQFADNRSVTAAAFLQPPWNGTCRHRWDAAAGRLSLAFEADALRLTVHAAARDDELDLWAEVAHTAVAIQRLDLPAGLCFPTAGVERVIFPQRSGRSVGIAFSRAFFERHGPDEAGAYRPYSVGPGPYTRLLGGPLKQLADDQPEGPLTVTAEGRQWFTSSQLRTIESHPMSVNRPAAEGQMPLVLVNSADGPALCGADLGGKGLLLRLCTRDRNDTRERDALTQETMLAGATAALLRTRPDTVGSKPMAVIELANGPRAGAWTAVAVARWRAVLQPLAPTGPVPVAIERPNQLLEVLKSGRFGVIVNPYGEWLPTGAQGRWSEFIEAIRAYVQAGGVWWEVGGYPFHYELVAEPFLSYTEQYPSATADFVHVARSGAGLSLTGVQPLMQRPWEFKDTPDRLTVPAELEVAGSEDGGRYRHAWHTAIPPGRACVLPPVRLAVGRSEQEAITAYAEAIGLRRRLEEKVSAPLLTALRGAVLVRYHGATAREQIDGLPLLPKGSLVHFAEYLHGGFDKQYPDHLPPNPAWGTADDLTAFYRAGHEQGFLMMPYTNTSWWCTGPNGPTFEKEGEAPLARRADGSLIKERYAANEGYAVCFWHPAVQAAHRRTREAMSRQYPSDILFQDQVGARTWLRDANPAAPLDTAWIDGLHSLSIEDTEYVPLATEDGYDRVANFEAMLCGMAWAIVPSRTAQGRNLNRDEFPAGEWEIYPLLQYLAHDKAVFTLHDLGHFVADPERQAYTLALGYGMSHATASASLRTPRNRTWLYWLDAVQKSVCSRYTGRPLLAFAYPFRGADGSGSREVMVARYGDVTVLANVGTAPCRLADVPGLDGLPELGRWRDLTVAGPGFLAAGPGLVAGLVWAAAAADDPGGAVGVVATAEPGRAARLTLLSAPGREVAVPVPTGLGESAGLRVSEYLPGEPRQPEPVAVRGTAAGPGVVRVRLPATSVLAPGAALPAEAAGKVPGRWPQPRRTVAVLDFGPGAPSSWTQVTPGDWLAELKASPGLAAAGCEVVAIRSPAELMSVLARQDAAPPLAVVNPYGEHIGVPRLEDWESALDRIAAYVRQGGIWWETGGYSFFLCGAPKTGTAGWETRNVGPSGAARFGFQAGGYEVDDPPRRLDLTAAGQRWLGPQRSQRLAGSSSGVQRPFAEAGVDTVLLAAGDDGFAAASRCAGWGWLWRLGGFNPVPAVAKEVVCGTIEYLAANPWPAPRTTGGPCLWTAVLADGGDR